MFDDKDKLLRRCLDELNWMIKDIKWRFDIDKVGDKGSNGGYSPELTRAMELREELEKYFKQGSDYEWIHQII